MEDMEAAIETMMGKEEGIFNMMGNEAGVSSIIWRCYSCNYSNPTKATVKAHVESKHILSSGSECSSCHKVCPTRHAMKMHSIRNEH